MLNVVVFGITLVVAQVIGGCIMTMVLMHMYMNKKALKKYSKMYVDLINEIQEEMFESEETES